MSAKLPPSKRKTVIIAWRCTTETRDKLSYLAASEHRTISNLLTSVMTKHIEDAAARLQRYENGR